MSINSVRPCPCGSGQPSSWLVDARGIALRRTCGVCHAEAVKKYRQEIFVNSDYWTDEPVEEQ